MDEYLLLESSGTTAALAWPGTEDPRPPVRGAVKLRVMERGM
jgi:hypothetical protein